MKKEIDTPLFTDEQIDSMVVDVAKVKITSKIQEAFDTLAQFFSTNGIHTTYLNINYGTAHKKVTRGTKPLQYADLIFYNQYSLECRGLKVENGKKEMVDITFKSKNVRDK